MLSFVSEYGFTKEPTMQTRRQFLQTSAAIAGSLILPRNLLANEPSKFFFIHTNTQEYWPVTDPVEWCLQFGTPVDASDHRSILERASDGLSKLSVNDGDRIIRLVLRRCSLNLLELHPGKVVVHHWRTKRADLKPWFKMNGLARPEIEVVLRDRKRETVNMMSGDTFLYGHPLTPDFPLDLFQKKWGSRFQNEPDDLEAAPSTNSGFAWDGVEDGCIPWTAMKSAWRRAGSGVCLDCDGETILTNFGLRPVGVFNRSPIFVSVCGKCRRWYRDDSMTDVGGWIRENLDVEVQPDAEMVWGKRLKLEAKS